MQVLEILDQLVAFPSVSCTSNLDISAWVRDFLSQRGFECEWLEYRDAQGVAKASIAARRGSGHGGFAYFAHTDVVPATTWEGSELGPWKLQRREGRAYGRGACDMKGSLACFLAALDLVDLDRLRRPLFVVVTADEEIGYGGAIHVQRHSRIYRQLVQQRACGLIGEPTCLQVVHAHKGSYGFVAISRGRAAHSSTREGINANWAMIPFLQEMKAIYDETEADPGWQDTRFDPPTVSWNLGINDHTAATNITAPQSIATVYFRPMPGQDAEKLLERARQAAQRLGLEFRVTARFAPFYRDPDSPFMRTLLEQTGQAEPRTVCYGTDACIFTDIESLAVLGPGDIAQAHTADEWISLEQLSCRHRIVRKIDRKVLWVSLLS
ncbi:MAG: acetylornithine deacetylase [Pirellulaceae bacterium]|nr:MAG: acetylornithine deacetylase [Pirellulaceae bacterium]